MIQDAQSPGYLTTVEAAEIFRVSPGTICEWVRQKKLTSVRVPGSKKILIPRSEIERLATPTDEVAA